MMHTMNTTGMYAVSTAFGSVHLLAMLAGFAGLVLLLAWAITSLPAAQLKQWGIWLLVSGILVSFLTLGGVYAARGGSNSMMKDGSCAMMGNGMKGGMGNMGTMGDMDSMKGMDANDHMGMSMNDMSAMLEGKTGDAFDKAFLEMMIPHHQGAIDMVKNAERDAKHEELKQLTRGIAAAQQKEIDMMRLWLKEWGYTK